MTHAHVACGSKLRSVVMSSMHPFPGNGLAIGRAVVYYARDAHAFSAKIMHQSPHPLPGAQFLSLIPTPRAHFVNHIFLYTHRANPLLRYDLAPYQRHE